MAVLVQLTHVRVPESIMELRDTLRAREVVLVDGTVKRHFRFTCSRHIYEFELEANTHEKPKFRF